MKVRSRVKAGPGSGARGSKWLLKHGQKRRKAMKVKTRIKAGPGGGRTPV